MDYQLLQVGDGRKEERVGDWLINRRAPAAQFLPAPNWSDCDWFFSRSKGPVGNWQARSPRAQQYAQQTSQPANSSLVLPEPLNLGFARLEVRLTDFGHLGFFPEQATNWDWLIRTVQSHARPLKLLNLFAYTGAATLAAAKAGAEVVHIDAAKNVVQWARKNATLSELQDRPVRWICEDAMRFCEREQRRGNQYDGVILDPPSYGHGPKREVWQIELQLPELLKSLSQLTNGAPQLLLLSWHTDELPVDVVQLMVRQAFPGLAEPTADFPLDLTAIDSGQTLPAGRCLRYG